MVWKGDSDGRVAKSLLVLFDQVDAAHPDRNKTSDGTIGDKRHQGTASDHNLDAKNIVKALDITHDPAHGVDTYALAEFMRTHPDKRVRYIISNGRIAGNANYVSANGGKVWQWARYGGSNPHDHHIHISVERSPALYDDETLWHLPGMREPMPVTPTPQLVPPVVPVAETVRAANRLKMAKDIIDFEARRDAHGHLKVYTLPSNDGGGRYEVAGINEKYDGPMVRELVALIDADKFDEAEQKAVRYIASNTDPAMAWTSNPAVESYLRDCIFNRGVRGATRILQRAVGVEDDGYIGPLTRAAVAKVPPAQLLLKLRMAREEYEREVVGYRGNLWTGLTNRWNGALKTAQSYLV